jgi:chaperonin GroES
MLGFKKLTPLLNRVVVKKAEPLTKTAGGILLNADKDKQLNWGTVIAVGPGKLGEDGKHIPCDVKAGQDVLLPEWGGSKITLAGNEELHIY